MEVSDGLIERFFFFFENEVLFHSNPSPGTHIKPISGDAAIKDRSQPAREEEIL
jgi:hypothetical protein